MSRLLGVRLLNKQSQSNKTKKIDHAQVLEESVRRQVFGIIVLFYCRPTFFVIIMITIDFVVAATIWCICWRAVVRIILLFAEHYTTIDKLHFRSEYSTYLKKLHKTIRIMLTNFWVYCLLNVMANFTSLLLSLQKPTFALFVFRFQSAGVVTFLQLRRISWNLVCFENNLEEWKG